MKKLLIILGLLIAAVAHAQSGEGYVRFNPLTGNLDYSVAVPSGLNITVRSGGSFIAASGSTIDFRSVNVLGLTIGTNVEAWNGNLDTLASLASGTFGRTMLQETSAANARTDLGLVIGTNVQAYNVNLTTFAGIAPAAFMQTFLASSTNATAEANIGATTVGKNIFTLATPGATSFLQLNSDGSVTVNTASAQRTALGLAIGTNVQASNANLTTIAGFAPGTFGETLYQEATAASARTDLALVPGTNVQTYSGNLASFAGVTPTTVGLNLASVANPSAVTFPRINADNTVSLLSASAFLTAIGGGSGVGSGTVTSVAVTVPTFLSVSGSPITASGTFAITLSGTALPLANGGSGATTAAAAGTNFGGTTVGQNIFTLTNPSAVTFMRINADNTVSTRTAAQLVTDLSLTIGTNTQAYNANLTTLSGIAAGTFGQTLLQEATAASARTDLALVPGTNVQTYSGNLASFAGVTPTTVGLNLASVANPSAVTFPRINADNTVSLLSASAFLAAIGGSGGGGGGSTILANTTTQIYGDVSGNTSVFWGFGGQTNPTHPIDIIDSTGIGVNLVASGSGTNGLIHFENSAGDGGDLWVGAANGSLAHTVVLQSGGNVDIRSGDGIYGGGSDWIILHNGYNVYGHGSLGVSWNEVDIGVNFQTVPLVVNGSITTQNGNGITSDGNIAAPNLAVTATAASDVTTNSPASAPSTYLTLNVIAGQHYKFTGGMFFQLTDDTTMGDVVIMSSSTATWSSFNLDVASTGQQRSGVSSTDAAHNTGISGGSNQIVSQTGNNGSGSSTAYHLLFTGDVVVTGNGTIVFGVASDAGGSGNNVTASQGGEIVATP